MGCEYCKYSNYGESDCNAPKKYRDNFCGVEFENERIMKRGSNYTPPKKKRRRK